MSYLSYFSYLLAADKSTSYLAEEGHPRNAVMKYEVAGNPDFGDLTIHLEPGEAIWSESGAMSRMSRHLDVNVHMIGGVAKAIGRKLVGGESLFVAEYVCPEKKDEEMFVSFAPAIPGTIMHRRMNGDES